MLGYYTLSAAGIEFRQPPPWHTRRLPKYHLAAARIGELAVDLSMRGLGLGGMLLIDALHRVLGLSEKMGPWSVVVDAIDEQAEWTGVNGW